MACTALYFHLKPFREHEMTLYWTSGVHTFDSGPSWAHRHSGMHGPNNFRPNCIHWVADIHFRGEDAKFRHRIMFEKRPQWYRTRAAVYVGKRIATLHVENNRLVRYIECHPPIQWCTVVILDADLVQRGAQQNKRRCFSWLL